MNSNFEQRLKAALRPVDPGDDFTVSVMNAVKREQLGSQSTAPSSRRFTQWASAALAACLVAAITVTVQVHKAREREAGLRAREQVLEALQVTSEKLNLAYRVVHPQTDTSDERKLRQRRPNDRGGA